MVAKTVARDKYAKARLAQATLRELTRLSPSRSLLAIAGDWALIAAAVALHQLWSNPLTWLVAWFVIATRLYAFYSLIHEAVHGLLVRDRRLNDLIGQVFLGLPLFLDLKAMRRVHFAHHKFLQADGDPELAHLNYREFQYPKSRGRFFLLLVLDLSGMNFLYYRLLKLSRWTTALARGRSGFSIRDYRQAVLSAGYAALFTVAVLSGFWKPLLLYWLIPYATLYQLLNRIRLTAEHFHLNGDPEYPVRSVVMHPAAAFFLAPHGLGFHGEHHLYPGVPFYRLGRLHRELCRDGGSPGHVVEHSYVSIFRKLVK